MSGPSKLPTFSIPANKSTNLLNSFDAPKAHRFYGESSPQRKTSPANAIRNSPTRTLPPTYTEEMRPESQKAPKDPECPLLPVLTIFIPAKEIKKLKKEASINKMETILCERADSFEEIKDKALAASKRVFPRTVDVEVQLCRWVGMAGGEHKMIVLHKIHEHNYDAVLEVLVYTNYGSFGFAIESLFEKRPSIVERLKEMMPGRKKRRLEDDASDDMV